MHEYLQAKPSTVHLFMEVHIILHLTEVSIICHNCVCEKWHLFVSSLVAIMIHYRAWEHHQHIWGLSCPNPPMHTVIRRFVTTPAPSGLVIKTDFCYLHPSYRLDGCVWKPPSGPEMRKKCLSKDRIFSYPLSLTLILGIRDITLSGLLTLSFCYQRCSC